MAEPLAVVSGSFAILSLALQLVETVQKLHTFWNSFENARHDIQRIKDHLATLHAVAATIAETCQGQPQIKCNEPVLSSMLACKVSTERLSHLMRKIGKGTRAGHWDRGWTKFRATLKDKTIAKIESQLNGDVLMLLLALQPFFHQIQQQNINLTHSQFALLSSAHEVLDGTTLDSSENGLSEDNSTLNLASKEAASSTLSRTGGRRWAHSKGQYLFFKFDYLQAVENFLAQLRLTLSRKWRDRIRYRMFSLVYSSTTHQLYLSTEHLVLPHIKRRMKIISPITAFQLQTASLPMSITFNPIAPCKSQIFEFCSDGNIEMVKMWFKDSFTSPFIVNQHGENLLHIAARYAHADLCNLLLDVGVDATAYDDRLLTPLDHLAAKVPFSVPYASRVVDTIRALVERGHCQPLLPITSNAVAFYNGPEEGFAWLFSSEYGNVDLEERDSEDWTLLGDAACNFGWWTKGCSENPAVSWQCLYLLKAGANPHSKSYQGRLTPLDAFLRGCTAHQVDHAGKWLQILSQSGIDLHKYAMEEQRLHYPEHLLESTWDEKLWRWVPTMRRVVYQFGDTPGDLSIWLEDYDALSWFSQGQFDLDIFLICSDVESEARWRKINDVDNIIKLEEQEESRILLRSSASNSKGLSSFLSTRWIQLLVVSLVLNYYFHVMLIGSK